METSNWRGRYLDYPISQKMAIAFLLGAVVGLIMGPRVVVLQPLGDLFIRLLKMLVLPIMITTILAGLSSISPQSLGRIGIRTVGWYMLTALAATVIGVAMANLLHLGVGLSMPGASSEIPKASSPALSQLLVGIVPENLIASTVEGELLPVIFFSILFALAVAGLRHSEHGDSAEPIDRLFEVGARGVYKILHWVMQYAPVGTFALIAITFGQQKLSAIPQFAKVIVTVYLAQALVSLGCLLLLLLSRINLLEFLRAIKDALITAFVTGSSAATLPVEMEAAQQNLRIDRSIFGFTLPLGVSIHKIGTAVHLGVVSIFAAHVAGLDLSLAQQVVTTLLAFLASIATPPISGGALIMLGFIFKEAGVPLQVIGLVAGIPLVGKFNTPINSLGRLVTTALVTRSEKAASTIW
jgi:Na+/H+-dicarboxylate symporter